MYICLSFILGIILGYAVRTKKHINGLNVTDYCDDYMSKQLKSYILQINKAIKKRGAQEDKELKVYGILDKDYKKLLTHIYNEQGYRVEDYDYYTSNGIIIKWDKSIGNGKNRSKVTETETK